MSDRHNKYNASEAGRARMRKYDQSEKGQARKRKWAASARGTVNELARRRRRLFVGETYLGTAKTVEQADQINAVLKEQLLGFKQRQSARTHCEDHPAG